MSTLTHKIDFALVLRVTNANPNGDPLNGNRPRTSYDGIGEITDVCLKRKLRDRLQEAGEPIFVQSDDNSTDGFKSLAERAKGVLKNALGGPDTAAMACRQLCSSAPPSPRPRAAGATPIGPKKLGQVQSWQANPARRPRSTAMKQDTGCRAKATSHSPAQASPKRSRTQSTTGRFS